MGLFSFLDRGTAGEMPEKSDRPKVLIGVAGFQGMVEEAQENLFAFAYHCGRRNPDYDFFVKILIKREQFRARNTLVEMALVNDCQWLLMLDDDMLIPRDLFERLVKHDKDICGALYFQRGGAYHPVLMRRLEGKDGALKCDFINSFDKTLMQPGLYPFDIIGGGCMLMKTDIFRKIPQPYFWIDGIVGTDVHLCIQLLQAGIQPYADTSIELGHLGERQIITSRTIPKYSLTLGRINEELWNDLKAYYTETDDELESAVIKAMESKSRSELWHAKPRETWEGVRDFYQSGNGMHVRSLAHFNMHFDPARDWAINEIGRVVKPGATIADYGAGIGYCSLPLAREGYKVVAMDLAKSPTLEFLKWRIALHKDQGIEIVPFETPVPPDLPEPVDGVLMISVLDHLWDPMGSLQWVTRNTKPKGFFLCDTWRNVQQSEEPQHLIKYDPHRVIHEFRKLGWKPVPENPFLFLKEA